MDLGGGDMILARVDGLEILGIAEDERGRFVKWRKAGERSPHRSRMHYMLTRNTISPAFAAYKDMVPLTSAIPISEDWESILSGIMGETE